jgi:outer membrane immunogenic protein
MRKIILTALLAGVVATPAFAQTAPNTGLRLEGVVGYDRAGVPGGKSDGVTYGVGVGYDMRVGGAIVGIEGELTDSTVDECTSDFLQVGDQVCAELGRDLYVGARVGAPIGRSSLVYAKAGYTNARAGVTYEDGTAGTALDFATRENLDGFRLGAGAEFGIGPNSYLKTEYRYSNYEQDFDRHQVVAGFGFRF